MKKKIAVFTNGWNDDYLEFALEGIRRRAAEDLGVPRPAHSLVPLGAVRGNVQEIAP